MNRPQRERLRDAQSQHAKSLMVAATNAASNHLKLFMQHIRGGQQRGGRDSTPSPSRRQRRRIRMRRSA
ncbi:MAG: hypothetical protein QGG71_25285 [Pirellulaceae bacterium]|nr:hypothetical protein [Pirellulaceae bacterium]